MRIDIEDPRGETGGGQLKVLETSGFARYQEPRHLRSSFDKRVKMLAVLKP